MTDLDGTLLCLDHTISAPNLQALNQLGEQNICRVAATGRSLYSLRKVIEPNIPFDYVIFTTGAGIINWQTQQIILSEHISPALVQSTFKKLLKLNEDFMFHAPIPDNHHFVAVRAKGLPDFNRRMGVYTEFGFLWDGKSELPWQEGTQFLVVADEQDESLYLSLIELLEPLKVVRTTSPFDHHSLWLEIFSPEVSKGSAVQFLLDLLGLERSQLMVVGNDYNDSEMLKLTQHSYVTSNAPPPLKRKYKVVSDHNADGFAEAVELWLEPFL
ncbi:MAG: HAD family hydrolase [Candidatus Cloacimonadaceae bacterium]